MLQKAVIGFLLLSVVGAAGVGVYDAVRPAVDEAAPTVEADTAALPEVTPVGPQGQGLQSQGRGGPSVERQGQAGAADGTGPIAVEQQQSLDMVGEPWSASGVIAEMDDFGLTLTLDDGSQVYVELGPPGFWQAQGVELAVNEAVQVEGFFNGEQIHAMTVTTAEGVQIALRSAEGQPLWSGGGAEGQGDGAGEPQIAPEDWVTMNGVITALDAMGLTMQTENGELLTLQLGQSGFWQSQGVALDVGDEIAVLGFWEGGQFQAGEITRLATGERIMLRDPNGRPLWGGPGRGGNGGASGQSGAPPDQSQGAGSYGQGGNGYQGGRNDAWTSGGNGYHGGRS